MSSSGESIKQYLKKSGGSQSIDSSLIAIKKTPIKNDSDNSHIVRYSVGLSDAAANKRGNGVKSCFDNDDQSENKSITTNSRAKLATASLTAPSKSMTPNKPVLPQWPKKSLSTVARLRSAATQSTSPMERVVFLVGGTGSGKTTLINSLTNYIYDIVQSDYFRFQVVSSEDERRHNSTLQSSSQTKTVIAYSFHQTRLDYVLTLVDTPGFGDTQGANVDKQTIGYIRSYFEQELADGINRLYAICLVIKSNETRLTAQFVSELNQVASLFGSDIQSNMFAIITFHDWSGDAPVLTAFRDHETIKFQSYFYINNSGIFAIANADSQITPTQELFWNKSINSLQQFLNCLQNLKPITLKQSYAVLTARAHIDIKIAELRENVNDELSLLQQAAVYLAYIKRNPATIEYAVPDQLPQQQTHSPLTEPSQGFIQRTVINVMKNLSRNRRIVIANTIRRRAKVYEVQKKDQDRVAEYHTNCMTCHRTCHKDCLMRFSVGIRLCEVMSNGKCKKCKHSSNEHKIQSELLLTTETGTSSNLSDGKRLTFVDEQQDEELDMKRTIREFMKTQQAICERYRQLQLLFSSLESNSIQLGNRTETITTFIDQMIADASREQMFVENVDMKQFNIEFMAQQRKYAELIVKHINDPSYNPMNELLGNRDDNNGWKLFRDQLIRWLEPAEAEDVDGVAANDDVKAIGKRMVEKL